MNLLTVYSNLIMDNATDMKLLAVNPQIIERSTYLIVVL